MEILAILMSATPGKSENYVQGSRKVLEHQKIPDVGKTGSSKPQKIIISGSLLQDLRIFSEIHFQAKILDHLFWERIIDLSAGNFYIWENLEQKKIKYNSFCTFCTFCFHWGVLAGGLHYFFAQEHFFLKLLASPCKQNCFKMGASI